MTSDPESLKRQLTAFAKFTTQSLAESDLDTLMLNACVRARAGVDVSHAKLLEYLPGRDRMLLRAGVGWREGFVGQYEVAPSLDTPIGHALVLAEPVAIEDYTKESRYRYPQILIEHGCIASVNVPLQIDSGTFGVLEVDHIAVRKFSDDDIWFLTGLSNTVAQAIKLKRALSVAEKAAPMPHATSCAAMASPRKRPSPSGPRSHSTPRRACPNTCTRSSRW